MTDRQIFFSGGQGRLLMCLLTLLITVAGTAGCGRDRDKAEARDLPRGYTDVLCLQSGENQYCFGPFVGYYFKPVRPGDLSRLTFICFNEAGFYTRDMPENSRIFEGEARLARLPDAGVPLPDSGRISPVFFKDAPEAWKESRPEPREEYLHFHSCYDSQGPVRTGFWLRHRALGLFTYDMGGRVGEDSPLYHRAAPGPDRSFPKIIEFDRGPARQAP